MGATIKHYVVSNFGSNRGFSSFLNGGTEITPWTIMSLAAGSSSGNAT